MGRFLMSGVCDVLSGRIVRQGQGFKIERLYDQRRAATDIRQCLIVWKADCRVSISLQRGFRSGLKQNTTSVHTTPLESKAIVSRHDQDRFNFPSSFFVDNNTASELH